MHADEFNLPSDFDGTARLFPLPELVFFPNNVLPLHIFESRYCEMFEDAIQDNHLITMATLQPGRQPEEDNCPAIGRVVCVGRIVVHEKTDQGTYNMMLLGLRRAQIEYEIEPVRSYRQAAIKLIAERSETTELSTLVREALMKRVVQSFPATEKFVEEISRQNISLASLTDVVAFQTPFPTELKLELLAEHDALSRAELLLKILSDGDAYGNQTKRFPPDFSLN